MKINIEGSVGELLDDHCQEKVDHKIGESHKKKNNPRICNLPNPNSFCHSSEGHIFSIYSGFS